MPSFNLVNDEWLPCLISNADGDGWTQKQLGIKQALVEAVSVREIVGDSPPVTVALHRLLLAILHRCFNGPKDSGEWGEMWRRKSFDAEKLEAYLTRWADRFNLFHEQHPFYQTASLDFERGGTVAQLFFKEGATLFDHATDEDPPALPPAQAARLLIAFQSFDFGGIKTAEKDKDFAKASPLIQCAVGLVHGKNLFETLMLNLHRYDAEDAEPFEFDPEQDLPAWEREEITKPADRYPSGYLDLLTWQSRRIRLQPAQENDEVTVSRAVTMKGYQFPGNFQRYNKELMVPFKKSLKPREDSDPWFAIGFREDKALWRDSLALFQSIDDKQTRPRMFDWLNDLAREGAINRAMMLPVDFFGLAADKAKPLFWRHERFMLPLAYLDNEALLTKLGESLSLAEAVGDVLKVSVKSLARYLLSPHFDAPNGRKPDEAKDVTPLADSFGALSSYWSRLESPFKQLLLSLPNGSRTDQENGEAYNEAALQAWANTLIATARSAFTRARNSLSDSGSDLKAAAKAERQFEGQLKEVRDKNPHLFPAKQTEGGRQ